MTPFLNDFCTFLKNSPTSYHAVEQIKGKLLKNNFYEVNKAWDLKKGGRYFCAREGSLIAFTLPKNRIEKALIYASHVDSPALKLKPQAEFVKEGMKLWAVEVYGAPLLSSWLNRDLALAGKVLYHNKDKLEETLINIYEPVAIIPQLALHLDREVNEKGLVLNRQEHLNALAPKTLTQLLDRKPLAHDLFLYPFEEPRVIGEKYLSSYRLDSLASVYPILESFLEKKPSDNLNMIAFFDHEEVGSNTAIGAESPFLSHTLERITKTRESYLNVLENSYLVSVDLAHSVHPNYPEKHDAQHKPQLGQGVLIKTHAQKRYATDAKSMRPIIEAAIKEKIPYQILATRNDIPSGSTIGPINASLNGITTVDIGIGQLSMHSARELIACEDLSHLKKLLSSIH